MLQATQLSGSKRHVNPSALIRWLNPLTEELMKNSDPGEFVPRKPAEEVGTDSQNQHHQEKRLLYKVLAVKGLLEPTCEAFVI